MTISDLDLDALRRALLWGHAFQRREPQLKLFPDPMPAEGTPAWLKLAQYFASLAQSYHLGLRPWQTPPIDVDDHCKPEEIALRQTMRDLNISVYEPDVPTAIANATHRASRRTDATRKVTRAKGK
jgi:hypothetical protein